MTRAQSFAYGLSLKRLLQAAIVSTGLLYPLRAIASEAVESKIVPADVQLVAIENSTLNAIATPEAILLEINRMRQSPDEYANWLRTFRPYYEGTSFRVPGERGIRTTEGAAALEDAISAMSTRQPAPPLALALALFNPPKII